MSGSLTWREYESDHGTLYSIRLDKSNASLRTNYTGENLCIVRGSNWKLPPKSLVLRRVHCFAQNNVKLKRSFIVGNKKVISSPFMEQGQEFFVRPGVTDGDIGVQYWVVTGYTGEKFTPPQFYGNPDTGIDDGTTDMIF